MSSHNFINTLLAAVLDHNSRTLKYMSVKIIMEENKSVKPKFAKLNWVSNLYIFDTL